MGFIIDKRFAFLPVKTSDGWVWWREYWVVLQYLSGAYDVPTKYIKYGKFTRFEDAKDYQALLLSGMIRALKGI